MVGTISDESDPHDRLHPVLSPNQQPHAKPLFVGQGSALLGSNALPDDILQERLIEAKALDQKIEQTTTEILIHLNTLSDGENRKNLEIATKKWSQAFDPFFDVPRDDYFHETRYRPFQRETIFDEQDHFNRSTHTTQAVTNVAAELTNLVLGVELRKKEGYDQRSPEQMEADLSKDKAAWIGIKKHYNSYFGIQMESALLKASHLIDERKRYKTRIFHQRIALVASVVLTCLGALFQKRSVLVTGTISSVVMLAYMFFTYGTSYMKQAGLGSDLQSSAEFLEKIALKNLDTQYPFIDE